MIFDALFQKRYLGIDIGGTKTEIVLALLKRDNFVVEKSAKIETGDGRDLISRIVAEIKKIKIKEIAGIGVGIAGQVDKKRGLVMNAPNIANFSNIKIVDKLEREIKKIFKKDIKIIVDNDVHCFLRAEKKFGDIEEYHSVVGLMIGTGIGGAMMIEGHIYSGANNVAGEFGHMAIKAGSKEIKLKTSKDLGIWEYYASGRAIEREYERLTSVKKEAEEICRLVNEDIFAERVVKQAAYYLGVGLANIVNIFDPEAIILGGGLSEVSLIKKIAADVLFHRALIKSKVKIVSSKNQYVVEKGALLLLLNRQK